jgi:hypothetical protein
MGQYHSRLPFMQLVDKKFVNKVCRGLSKQEKALVMLAVLLSTPRISMSDLIPIQELPLPKGIVFYPDLKTK